MKVLTADLAAITGGKLYGSHELPVYEVFTDSRQITYSDGLAFIAIRGKNHDGHHFIINLYEKGVRVFIVERLVPEIKEYTDAAFIVTGNSVTALQKLGAFVRKSFASPVIAVTGSAGKTIVKEWLADILGITQPVIRSPRSYNSQIGVPLSVLKLEDKYRMAVFEAGISMPGEMDNLQKIIDPDIGVFTNIGEAHSENFQDNRTKALEKLKLFRNARMIIYCKDDNLIDNIISKDQVLSSKDLYGWSAEKRNARIYVTKYV